MNSPPRFRLRGLLPALVLLSFLLASHAAPARSGGPVVRLSLDGGISGLPHTSDTNLEMSFRYDGTQCGPCVWGKNAGRSDQYGRVLTSSTSDSAIKLKVRMFLNDRYTDKPYRRPRLRRAGEYSLQLTKNGDSVSGNWTAQFGDEKLSGSLSGTVERDLPVADGFVPPRPGEHPRLLLRRSDIAAVKKKMSTAWGQKAVAALKGKDRSRSNMAVGRGLLYVLTGDKRYAMEAQKLLEADIDGYEWLPIGEVHAPAHTAMEAVIAYDLIYDACDPAFRAKMHRQILAVVGDLHNFSNVTRPNGNVASNWSAMYRGGCGMAGLMLAAIAGPLPPEPVKPVLAKLKPPADLTVEDGLHIEKLVNDREWHDGWLYAGPFRLARGQDALESLGGAAKVRPRTGTKVSGQGLEGPFSGEFKPLPKWLLTKKVHHGLRWGYGSFFLSGLHQKPLTGNKPFTTMYFYCVMEVTTPGFYKVNLIEYQMDNPCIFIAGRRLKRGDYVYLEKGRYPVMAWLPTLKFVPTNSHDRNNICFRLRLKTATKDEAERWIKYENEWYAMKLAEFNDMKKASGGRPYVHHEGAYYAELGRRHVYPWTIQALGDHGWNSEGEAYNQHSYRVVLPFAHCLRNATGKELGPKTNVGWVLPHYTTCTIFRKDGAFMHTYGWGGGPLGVDSYPRGLALVEDRLKPAVMWACNRTQALADSGKLKNAWLTRHELDPMSAAFMLVNYPQDGAEVNPETVLSKVMVDEHKGGYVFRNRWKDDDDIVATILLNNPQPGARNSSNTGCFRISGLGGDWAVRGTEGRSMKSNNRLLLGNSVGRAAAKTFFESQPDGSGVISMDMSAQYGGAKVLRSFAVDYSGKAGVPGLVVVVDKADKGPATWQMVTDQSMPVKIDGNRFILTKGDASFQATVISPASPKITTVPAEHGHELIYLGKHRNGKFQRKVINVSGGNFFFIVMTMQKGPAPAAKTMGRGEDARVTLGARTISFDKEKVVIK